MKYLLLMTGTKAGVDTYRAWSKTDVERHFAHLTSLNKDLREAGELVANEGLASPMQAKVVRAGKDGVPITDGIFPEAKEFLLGYWLVDVESPERAYEIAQAGIAMRDDPRLRFGRFHNMLDLVRRPPPVAIKS